MILIFLLIIPIFIIAALVDACGASQRKAQTRELIKAQRDLAIEKGEIKAPEANKGLWWWLTAPATETKPVRSTIAFTPPKIITPKVTAPRKVTGEVYNFTTQKWENTYASE